MPVIPVPQMINTLMADPQLEEVINYLRDDWRARAILEKAANWLNYHYATDSELSSVMEDVLAQLHPGLNLVQVLICLRWVSLPPAMTTPKEEEEVDYGWTPMTQDEIDLVNKVYPASEEED